MKKSSNAAIAHEWAPDRIVCHASFTVEKWESAKAAIDAQIAYWEYPAPEGTEQPP
ncbi:hypothetical protein [Burkholderia gladioli]|uniref:hypothetical protein n=1 Tax=Burkholderia gladioli TaxID=28095 RepID=UPI00163F1D42|nr:hypothetical protein [Burkholderia gladioli]